MIIYGCIEIHPKGYRGWIVVIGFKVLLIIHYLIQEILVEEVLDVHTRGIKRVYKEIFVLVCTQRTIYSS